MDDVDRAVDREQQFRDDAIEERRRAADVDISGTGECLNCGDPVKVGRWCNVSCRDDWEVNRTKFK